ncbi:hypothetical protein KBB96_14770 [Luteolibacter ambystomatis]|uniref:Uncharacterized protein n=1 Tax=Luteolibacter ambystomatis TaxID=2824561 RepID=A0A975G7D5_9BACT|nr:hypothetical protein [Luteolibacter ambystomatis]QUE50126.1 hypothetical protein KBB96_14770 [Luteolibacter ambystomatis]
MSDQTRISSIEALESFRGDLIRYINQARSALEEMVGDVRRTRTWLDTDRIQHWGMQVKRHTKKLEQAEQELYSATLTDPKGSHALQKMNVMKCKRLVEEAEARLRVIQQWRKQFDNRAEPLVRQLDRMFGLLGQQLPRGVVSLGETIKALQAYAETKRPLKPSDSATETPTDPSSPS